MIVTTEMEHVAKEISTSIKNRDWSRLNEANNFKQKCCFTEEQKRWIKTLIDNE